MKFLFLFSSKSLLVLSFTFMSVIHFELIFYMAKVRVNFIFFFFPHEDIQFSHHHLLERLFFPHWTVLAPLSNIIWWYMYMIDVYFLALYSSPLMCLSVFMAVSYCFDCCSFITSFQIKMCESDFVLLFKTQCFDNLILEMTANLPYFIH